MLLNRIKALWCPMDSFRVIDLEDNYYFVKFFNYNDYLNVLVNRLWLVQGHYLTVQLWHPSFSVESYKISSVVA